MLITTDFTNKHKTNDQIIAENVVIISSDCYYDVTYLELWLDIFLKRLQTSEFLNLNILVLFLHIFKMTSIFSQHKNNYYAYCFNLINLIGTNYVCKSSDNFYWNPSSCAFVTLSNLFCIRFIALENITMQYIIGTAIRLVLILRIRSNKISGRNSLVVCYRCKYKDQMAFSNLCQYKKKNS